jgi:hypothetical protein
VTIQSSAFVLVHPNFMEPDIIMQYSQSSGFVDVLADGQMRTKIAEDDLFVYVKQMNLRTKMAAGQASYNELPGVDISTSMISTATYLFRCASIYDHHDVQTGNRWGYSVPQAYTLGMRQGNFILARDACLYGLNPANFEGLVNSPTATAINLPPDSNGNTNVLTYDNGQMAFFLSLQVQAIKTRTYQMGSGRRFTILGPQRTLGPFEYNVVQLVQYQRQGAGTMSTAGTFKEILMSNGDTLVWAYDDTLIGKGVGSTANAPIDLVILVMPEVEVPKGGKAVNTNVFASLTPNNPTCTTQYCDMAAPREIVSPMAEGKTHVMTEWRISSGWGLRGEAITLISMPY